jgi:hypothetical protein
MAELRTADLPLETMHLTNEPGPGACDDPRIVTDGSWRPGLHYVAAAAVSTSGSTVIGWHRTPAPAGGAVYAELLGLLLGLRMAQATPGAGVPIECDDPAAAREITRARKGGKICPALFPGTPPTVFREITALARHLPSQVILATSHTPAVGPNLAAAGPLETTAHRLAWTACRLLCDGFDPAWQEEYFALVLTRTSRDRDNIKRTYRKDIKRLRNRPSLEQAETAS